MKKSCATCTSWSFIERWRSNPYYDEVRYKCLDCGTVKCEHEEKLPDRFVVGTSLFERVLITLIAHPALRWIRFGRFYLNYQVAGNGATCSRQEGPYLTYAAAVEGARFMDTPAFSDIRIGRTLLKPLEEKTA